MMNYSECLRDPRWQKKRLMIMQRDNFTCQICNQGVNDGTPLNVHHIEYKENRLPWEYSNEELVTLCEDCHHKVHTKEIDLKKVFQAKKQINFVFYKYFFSKRSEFAPGESIIYSCLIGNAVKKASWNPTIKRIDISIAKKVINTNIENGFGEVLPYAQKSISALSRQVEMTRPNLRRILNSLRERGILSDEYIKCPLAVLEQGFIQLPEKTKLRGQQLIVFAYIRWKSQMYGGGIDTWASELGKILGITETNVHSILSILHKKGFVKRDNSTKKLIVY